MDSYLLLFYAVQLRLNAVSAPSRFTRCPLTHGNGRYGIGLILHRKKNIKVLIEYRDEKTNYTPQIIYNE